MKTVFIYALCEPGTRIIRYIGKAKNPGQRIKEHCEPFRLRKNHLGCWLRSLNSRPSLIVLKEILEIEWQEWEQRYIRCARALGFDLVNGTDGGEGLNNPTPQTREKLRAANLGKKQSEETCAKKSAAHLGKKRSPGSIEKSRAGNLGKTRSEEARARMRGPRPSFSKENHPLWGKKLSEEDRSKMCGPRSAFSKLKGRGSRCFNRLLKICQPLE